MNSIGNKIRFLRKNRGLTQGQLAEALSVSAQSVSKWETCASAPDISLLPVLARYFGITMDDLFDYRADALTHKERFVRFMKDNGMLRFGSFRLQSGRVSPYLIHSGYYRTGSQITRLGEFYAACIRGHGLEGNRLVGNATRSVDDAGREIPLVIATCMALYGQYGVDTDYCIDDTLVDDPVGGDMTLIMDTFTSGNTLRKTLAHIKARTGRYPSSIIVSVDRMERSGESPLSARREIEKDFGVRIYAIVTVDDIIHALRRGVVGGAEYLEEIQEYRTRYGGRDEGGMDI